MSEIKSVHILSCLPGCMLPDGGEACKGFVNAAMRVDEQQARIEALESENKRLRAFAKELKRTYLLSPHIQLWANWALTGDSAKEPSSASSGSSAYAELREAAREAVDAVRFQKPEHERAAIDALAALLEKTDE